MSDLEAAVETRLAKFSAENTVERVWARDHTVWRDDPVEIENRLGWLDLHESMRDRVRELESFAALAEGEGLHDAVLCGMGGSSLAPEVLRRTFGPGPLELSVLDTTHPDGIARLLEAIDPDRTLVIAASKSGTTVETLSHLALFRRRVPRPGHLVVVTDPGSSLAEEALTGGFRDVFLNPPDIGGRYSALSLFGLVPGALCDISIPGLLDGAAAMATACGASVPLDQNPAARLGAALGEAALAGRDKLTLVLPGELEALGPWIEQLVAESTGKEGRGILPVEGEPLGTADVYGDDRLFVVMGEHPGIAGLEAAGHAVVSLPFDGVSAETVGGLFFLWEMAVVLAGAVVGIQPFDQPDVQAAKEATSRRLEGAGDPPRSGDPAEVVASLGPGDYLAIQAFLPGTRENHERLQAARLRIRDSRRVATTVGFGPRFLHSTGQLHKGGPPSGAFLQVVDEPVVDLPVPGHSYSFAELIRAQADGDLEALRARGRRVARTTLRGLEAAAGP